MSVLRLGQVIELTLDCKFARALPNSAALRKGNCYRNVTSSLTPLDFGRRCLRHWRHGVLKLEMAVPRARATCGSPVAGHCAGTSPGLVFF